MMTMKNVSLIAVDDPLSRAPKAASLISTDSVIDSVKKKKSLFMKRASPSPIGSRGHIYITIPSPFERSFIVTLPLCRDENIEHIYLEH
jgi:hypothetical protein